MNNNAVNQACFCIPRLQVLTDSSILSSFHSSTFYNQMLHVQIEFEFVMILLHLKLRGFTVVFILYNDSAWYSQLVLHMQVMNNNAANQACFCIPRLQVLTDSSILSSFHYQHFIIRCRSWFILQFHFVVYYLV